jgi:serine/threonine-protein kinase
VFGQDPLGGTKLNKGSTVTLRVSQGPGNVPIPSVNGLSEQQAKARIARAHLKVDRVQNEPSDQVAAGLATRTEPAVGQSEPVGTPITLFVSSGPAPVSVPDVTGQPEAQASGTLREAGFRVSSSTQESSTDTPGTVISQSPTGTAPPHSTVSIVVAKAPTTATVPNVVGSTASSAAAQLTAAGFTVQQHTKDVTKATQNGVVLSQSPAANSTAKKSSAVTIVVGKYKAPPPTTSTTSTTTTSTTTTTTTTSP